MTRAIFRSSQEEAESTWTVDTADGTLTVSLAELFPSGKYDVHEVRSRAFGISLIKRLEGNPGATLKQLISNNSIINVAEALEVMDLERIPVVIGEFIPLNDAERQFRDELKGACHGG